MIQVENKEAVAALAAATNWRKSSYSQGQNGCVGVGSAATVVGVRDTKLGAGSPILAFSQQNWSAFIELAKEANR